MPDIIRLLPDSLANQIAAGEVVQRPASVVKELLENALDAGATQIQIAVKEAGKALIQVTDNGSGMSQTDARMCFERHATSKIRQVDDLFKIRSFGFRGEAMASIAAVAQVDLKTCHAENGLGTQIIIEGSKVVLQEPCAHPKGTQISVKNLFFNVPARRNFLKSNQVEWKHIVEEFTRIALAHPEVSFELWHNGTEVMQLRPGKLAQRIVALFGKTWKENLLPCREELSDTSLYGYVGKPEAARKTRGEQFFFINNRFIRHPYLHHAVMTAFERLIPEGSYPFYVIKLSADPATIDVNVHPTKTEVKFENERSMYALVQAAVRQALGVHHLSPAIDFELDANFDQPGRMTDQQDDTPLSPAEYELFRSHTVSNKKQQGWEQLYPTPKRPLAQPETYREPMPPLAEVPGLPELTTHTAPQLFSADTGTLLKPGLQLLHGRYILSQVKSGLMLLDIRAAYERIFYEDQLRRYGSATKEDAQPLLFPQPIELAPTDLAQVSAFSEELVRLGLQIELLDSNRLLCKTVPAGWETIDPVAVITDLIQQAAHFTDRLRLGKRESIAAIVAGRQAARAPLPYSDDAMQALINRLFTCQQPNYTPDGRKTTSIINLDTLESLFI
ncbi:DNA mismatch repair endonuclease MutL [Rhodoflexus sp.]